MPSSAQDHLSLEEVLDRRSRRLRGLVLLLSVGIGVGFVVFALTRLVPPSPDGLGADFRLFYAAATALARGSDPYRLSVLQAAEQATQHYPGHGPGPTLDRLAVPPVAGAALIPLTRIGFWPAYALFTGVGLLALALVTALLGRDLGWRHLGGLELGVVASWIVALGLLSGQFDALTFAAVGGAMLLAWHERPLPAGLVMGLVWVMPELLWPAPLLLFLVLLGHRSRAFRFALGFAITTAASVSVYPGLLPAWWKALWSSGGSVAHQPPNLAGLPTLAGAAPASWKLSAGLLAPGTLATGFLALLAIGIFSTWMLTSKDWERVSQVGRIAWGVGLPLAIWLAATPYAHINDDLLLLPLFMLTVGRDARRIHGLGLGLALVVVIWLLLIWPSGVLPWPVGLAVLALLSIGLWHWRTDERLTGFGAGLCLLALAILPAVSQFDLLRVGLTPVAVLILVVEGARTCWMEVGGAGTGPAYVTEAQPEVTIASSAVGG